MDTDKIAEHIARTIALDYGIKWDNLHDEYKKPYLRDAHRALEAALPYVIPQVILDHKEAYLGLATTKEMIFELQARAEIAHSIGEEWSSSLKITGPHIRYKTTKELLDELKYRVHLSDELGATWPGYRTVDGGFSIDVDVQEE